MTQHLPFFPHFFRFRGRFSLLEQTRFLVLLLGEIPRKPRVPSLVRGVGFLFLLLEEVFRLQPCSIQNPRFVLLFKMGALNSKDAGEEAGSWKKERELYDERQRRNDGSGVDGMSASVLELQLHEDAAVLDNLDKRAVERLWDNFIREASSFAVNKEQLSRTFLAVR